MKFNLEFKKKKHEEKSNHKFGLDANEDLELLIYACKQKMPKFNEPLIRKAFDVCRTAHLNKLRKSGDPFYTHPLAVAMIVVNEIPLDDISVAAALLHNVPDEGSGFTINDIRNEFGPAITQIVEGVSKIKFVEAQHINDQNQMESYRRLILSLFKDVRIILIKVADRLHNMRTLDNVSQESQRRAANEMLEIYAPFANRFGLRNIKWELEDLAFKYLNRSAYDQIKLALKGTREDREDYIESFIAPIVETLAADELLKRNKIKFEISGRPKHIYSIFNKMKLRQKSMDELFDLFAIRVVLDTEDKYLCFYVYGLIAGIYAPVPETFKDYISSPKKNGYQSIHTAVIGLNKRPVEVQIRTRKMDDLSEQGVAAHFRYKSTKHDKESVLEDNQLQNWLDGVKQIFQNVGNETTPQLLEAVRKNLFRDEIYVFTPGNEFRSLPKDATPLDFAYDIHSEIGNNCIGAKINGKIVPLNHKLESGDQVEILTSKHQKPVKEWLNFVVTSKASSAIYKLLKDEEKRIETEGMEIWKRKSKEQGFVLSDEEFEILVKSLNMGSVSDFYQSLGNGQVDLSKAYDFIKFKIRDGFRIPFENLKPVNMPANDNDLSIVTKIGKKLDKEKFTNIKFSKCCIPLPCEQIIGIKANESDVDIHLVSCIKAQKAIKTRRNDVFDISWSDLEQHLAAVDVNVKGDDRENMLSDITKTILNVQGVKIQKVAFDTIETVFEGIITLQLKNNCDFALLCKQIEAVEGVSSVNKLLRG